MGLQRLGTLASLLILFASFTAFANSNSPFPEIEVTKLIVMPNSSGHSDWVDAINGASSSVHMTMYHITDKAMVTALINKAQDSSVDVRVIVDAGSLKGGYQTVFKQMQTGGVNIVASSKKFSLSHSKDMVIDGQTAFVSAINMTNTASNTRDFGIITPDRGIISEIESVFEADWQNAQNQTKNTPEVTNPNLAWSPTTSGPVLLQLIDSASTSIVAETESFDDTDIVDHLNQAAARGVKVRFIAPECDLGNPLFDYQALGQLSGVQVHVEHDGDSVQQPYMHSKMMLIDGTTAYIGSINYSFNSVQNDRELGVVFKNAAITAQLAQEFETDWNRSQAPAANPSCSSSSGSSTNSSPIQSQLKFGPDDVNNFSQVTADIYRGARPQGEDLQKLIIQFLIFSDVDLEDSKSTVQNEKSTAEQLGLQFLSTEMNSDVTPSDAEVDGVLAQLTNSTNFPIFIHCHYGEDRTGMIIGLYRVEVQGWTPARAYQEMIANGFHPSLTALLNYFKHRTGYSGN